MKRTFLAMVMAGSSMAMFAQTTPTTPTSPTTTPTGTPTTSPTTTPTTSPTTTTPTTTPTTNQSTTNNSVTNSTTDPMNTTTNQMNNTSVNTSTSWAPGTSPAWGWNGYGLWNGSSLNTTTSANMNTSNNPNANMNGVNNMNNMNASTNMNGSMSSTGSYNAYGTAVPALPANVQMRFSQDFPSTANQQYTWSQYGDWFHTQYMSNGRSMHYFYDQRGNGYALALPVIQTYVPEDIIDKALNKYGSSLYSISMVRAQDSGNTYQLGIIERGQMRTEYLNESGATVANVWRVEDMNGSLNSTDANAAMGSQPTTTDAMATDAAGSMNSSMSSPSSESKMKTKTKIKHADGTETKIKTKEGKTKVKTDGKPSSSPDMQ